MQSPLSSLPPTCHYFPIEEGVFRRKGERCVFLRGLARFQNLLLLLLSSSYQMTLHPPVILAMLNFLDNGKRWQRPWAPTALPTVSSQSPVVFTAILEPLLSLGIVLLPVLFPNPSSLLPSPKSWCCCFFFPSSPTPQGEKKEEIKKFCPGWESWDLRKDTHCKVRGYSYLRILGSWEESRVAKAGATRSRGGRTHGIPRG